MFSLFYLSVFQLVESNQTDSRELFEAAYEGDPVADINFGAAFWLSPTSMAVHYAMEAKNKAMASVHGQARSLQDTPDAAISQCSSWKSIGHIKGGIPFSKGVFCQVGIGAAEGNEWKQCVDGTTEPAPPAVMYTGICPGSVTDDEIAALREAQKAAGKDRSLQDTPDAAFSQCSSWKSIGHFKGGMPFSKGVFCQVGLNAAEGNEWKQCVDETAVYVSGFCPGSVTNDELVAALREAQKAAGKDRSLQDSPVAATKQCTSWCSLGHLLHTTETVWQCANYSTTKTAQPATYGGPCGPEGPDGHPEYVGDLHV